MTFANIVQLNHISRLINISGKKIDGWALKIYRIVIAGILLKDRRKKD